MQTQQKENELALSYKQYQMMRNAFEEVFSESVDHCQKKDEELRQLHKLGQVIWECSKDPLVQEHLIELKKVKISHFHSQIHSLLTKIRGGPYFCYNEGQPDCKCGENTLYLAVKNGEEWQWMGTVDDLNIGELIKCAKPSPFGDLTKMETVYDKSVRDAWEISDFHFWKPSPKKYKYQKSDEEREDDENENEDENPDEDEENNEDQENENSDEERGESEMMKVEDEQENGEDLENENESPDEEEHEMIATELATNWLRLEEAIGGALKLTKSITLQPHKLNIYQEGGFFSAHTDTPEDPKSTIGSLVITLPMEYEGGEFVITRGNEQHEFPYSPWSWIAFFGDCLHEVKPVTKGTRITVTYHINLAEPDRKYEVPYWCELRAIGMYAEPQAQLPAIEELSEVLKKGPDPAVGIILDHKYTHSALDLGVLKGADAVLAHALKKLGFKVTLQSVLYRTCAVIPQDVCDDERPSSKKFVYSWTQQDLHYVLRKGPKQKHVLQNVPFFRLAPLGQVMDEKDIEGAEHTGNEARDSEFQKLFWNAALIVEKPTWWTLARLLWIAKKKNSRDNCQVARLDSDVIRLICNLLQHEENTCHRNKRQKRS